MSNNIQPASRTYWENDASLFLALAAWMVTAGSLGYVFANLGSLWTIIFKEHFNHFLVSANCAVVGVLGMFCLCCGLAKVVFKFGYTKFSKKGF